jgi:hypothetical protein
VSVSDDRFLDGLPGIDIEIALFAIQPARRESYQPAPFHMRLFYRNRRLIPRTCYFDSPASVSSSRSFSIEHQPFRFGVLKRLVFAKSVEECRSISIRSSSTQARMVEMISVILSVPPVAE